MARSGRRLIGFAALSIFVTVSCAEIPTAPRVPFTFVGSVQTRDGDPVSGATIHIHAHSPGHELLHEAETALNGTFAIPMAPGIYDLEIIPTQYSGFPQVNLGGHRVGPDNARLDYRFEGWRVDGTVTDRSGAGRAASVYVNGRSNQQYVYAATRTFNGSFRLYIPDGVYDIEVFPLSFADGLPSRTFQDMAVRSDTTAVFELTGRHVTGVATGPDGAPLADAFISFESSRNRSAAHTKSDGSYELYMPDGVCEIHGYAGSNQQFIQERSFGVVNVSSDFVRDLSFAGTWWQGTVRDGAGSPIPDAYVSVTEFVRGFSALAFTDAAGKFRVSVIQGAWHDVRVYASGLGSATFGPIPAGADSTLDCVVEASSLSLAGPARPGVETGRTSARPTLPAARGGAE